MSSPFDPTLLRVLPQVRRPVTVLAAVGVLSGALALGQALALAWTVTAVVRGTPLQGPLTLLAVLLVLRGLLAATGEVVARAAGRSVAGAVRAGLLTRWLEVPAEDRPDPDSALTLAGRGADSLEPYVARYLPALVTAAVVPALAVLTLLVIDPWSALIVVLTLPLLPVFAALIGLHTRAETGRRWAALGALSGHFLDVVRGLPTLVSYGRAHRQVATVEAVGRRHRLATVATLRTAFLSSAALELLATISVAMVAVCVGLRLAYGAMDLEVALMAILLAPEAYWPIRRVGAEFHTAADGAAAWEQARPHLQARSERRQARPEHQQRPDAADRHDPAQPPDAVRTDTLGYAYPDREPVLVGLSVRAPAGPGLTVLTGPSGSGKSTLLELLAGLRTPAAGSVSCGPAHLATQRPLLLPGTVGEALRLGAPDADVTDCHRVLRAVGLWTALQQRDGLDTDLGDDGFGLSAGQRTRLALARAMLSSPALLLLDEPTAHVAEADVPALLALVTDLAADRRVVVATHDDRLLRHADSHWRLDPPARADRPANATVTRPPGEEAAVTPVQEEVSWWQRLPLRTRSRLACLLGGASVSSGVALTATSGWLIVQASTRPVVLTLLVAIVGVRTFGIARPVLRYAERVVSHDAALQTLALSRVQVYTRLIPLTPARLGRKGRGDLLTALVDDLGDVVDDQVRATVPWWSTTIAGVAAVALTALFLPAAAAVLAAGAVAAALVGLWSRRSERTAQDSAVRARARVLGRSAAVASRLGQVQAVLGSGPGRAGAVVETVRAADADLTRAEGRLIRARAQALALAWCVVAATATAVAVLAAQAVGAGTVSAPVGALVALTPMALADAWVGLPEVGGAGARARAAAERIRVVLDQEPAVRGDGLLELADGLLPVTVQDVAATWAPEQAPVGPVTLPALGPGARVQLTGPNGVGKSTLLAVVARHLDPVAGEHRMAGLPAGQVSLDSARAHIAVVDDEPHVFSGTLHANLALARPDAGDDEMVSALRAVDLDGWLSHQREGLWTTLVGLSGGERTRLALARAVLSGRAVVLLDEPAAHLDDATAERALGPLLAHGDQAVVVVSHRPMAWTGLTTLELGAVRDPVRVLSDVAGRE